MLCRLWALHLCLTGICAESLDANVSVPKRASLLLRVTSHKKQGPFLHSFIRQNFGFCAYIGPKPCCSLVVPHSPVSFWDYSHTRDWWVNADNPGCIQPKNWSCFCCKPLNPCLGFFLKVYPSSCQSAHGGFPAELSVGCLATSIWGCTVRFGSGDNPLMSPCYQGCGGAACPELRSVVRTHPSSVLQHQLQNLTIMLNFIPANECLIKQEHRNSPTASSLLQPLCCPAILCVQGVWFKSKQKLLKHRIIEPFRLKRPLRPLSPAINPALSSLPCPLFNLSASFGRQ